MREGVFHFGAHQCVLIGGMLQSCAPIFLCDVYIPRMRHYALLVDHNTLNTFKRNFVYHV